MTPRLGAPELVQSQASPETKVNEMVRYLESGVGHFVLVDRDLAAAPASPTDGQTYLVAGTPASGDAWFGKGGKIAYYLNTAWIFITVLEGFTFWVMDEDKFLVATSVSTFQEFATTTGGGVHDMPIMAPAMKPRTTAGAAAGSSETTTNKVMVETLDFDPTTDEFAQFSVPMPKSWNEGTVTAKFIWTATATGDAVWGIQAVAISDDDVLDAAFGAAQTVTDSVTAANDLMHSAFTAALTVAGTPAERDLVVFQVYRDADNAADTLAADAKLLGIVLQLTTNARDDS